MARLGNARASPRKAISEDRSVSLVRDDISGSDRREGCFVVICGSAAVLQPATTTFFPSRQSLWQKEEPSNREKTTMAIHNISIIVAVKSECVQICMQHASR
jgi:hypothetical protein